VKPSSQVPFTISETKRRGLYAQRLWARRQIALLSLVVIFIGAWGRLGSGPDTPWINWATLALALFASLTVALGLMIEMEHENEWPAPAEDDRLGPFDYHSLQAWGKAVLLLAALHAAGLAWLLVAALVSGSTVVWPWAGGAAWALMAVTLVVANLAAWSSRSQPPPGITAPSLQEDGTVPADRGELVVACSGGGIRAAAFVLGGINALQARHEGPAPDVSAEYLQASPRLVAVSGGSYLAAAMAITRNWEAVGAREAQEAQEGQEAVEAQGAQEAPEARGGTALASRRRERPLPWWQTYTLLSPEVLRLRRHTRDLFEPATHVASGLIALVSGALVNIVIFVAGLRLAAWVLWWFAASAGTLRVIDTSADRGVEGTARLSLLERTAAGLPTGLRLVLAVTLVIAVVAGLATLRWWWLQRQRDIGAPPRSDSWYERGDRIELGRLRQLGWTAALLAWLTVAIVVPAVLYGLSTASLHNVPTPTIAKAINGLGLTTMPLCRDAAGQSVVDAAHAAAADATISPGEKRSYDAGACGYETKVEFTLDKSGSLCPASNRATCPTDSDRFWRQLGADFVSQSSFSSKAGFAGQLTGIAALLLAIAGALRKASTSEAPVVTGLRARLQRLLLAWLPLTAALLVVLWLLLKWMFQSLVNPGSSGSPVQLALPLIGLGVALWLDANVTSMHGYYRRRLSSAFAVGRIAGRPDHTADAAVELDPTRPYLFSELQDNDLAIVTTANIRAPGSTPTRRGGIPLVFNRERVAMEAGPAAYVPMPDFERLVGEGRATIMATVAMSGAAVSPMAGRFASQVAPFRLLLTLMNVRLGMWIPNPLWGWHPAGPVAAKGRHEARLWEVLTGWPQVGWLGRRPGSAQVLVEAVGRSALTDRWIYVSDGGHLDNTGLVEAVRMSGRPDGSGGVSYSGRVLVLDASNDQLGTWEAVGDALAVLRADLGLSLAPDKQASKSAVPESATSGAVPPNGRRRHGRHAGTPTTDPDYTRVYRGDGLTVVVVKAVRPSDVAASDLPDSVKTFALTHQDFPRAATNRQDFGDLEFEAYRALGEWCTSQALELL
jgi:hypothetical protein